MTRYRWVDSQRAAGFLVTVACAVAGVSTSGFYAWLASMRIGPSAADLDEAYLVRDILDVHAASDGTYGVPRVTAALRRAGRDVNHKRVERLMRVYGVEGIHKRHRIRTTIPAEDNPPIPDLVGRRFAAGRPDTAWCSDITYIRTGEGWLFLASVLDLGSRRLLGYAMADHMRTELITDALDMAVAARGGQVAGVIAHADRGSQYMSASYQETIAAYGLLASVGRTGVCWDNSVAESFWSTLKRELVHRQQYPTRADARRAIFVWINYYNRTRLHSTLGYLPPLEWEQLYTQEHTISGDQAA